MSTDTADVEPLVTLYTPGEVAVQFRTRGDRWLRDGARRGLFPHCRVGNKIMFSPEDVVAIHRIRSRPATAEPVDQGVPAQSTGSGSGVAAFKTSARSAARRRRATS